MKVEEDTYLCSGMYENISKILLHEVSTLIEKSSRNFIYNI